MMTPDANRQWFVFYNSKEMGPYPESELLQKLKASEFDSTAYVFTEGMKDWALVNDTAVLLTSGPKVEATQGPWTKESSTQSRVMKAPAENPFADIVSPESSSAKASAPESELKLEMLPEEKTSVHAAASSAVASAAAKGSGSIAESKSVPAANTSAASTTESKSGSAASTSAALTATTSTAATTAQMQSSVSNISAAKVAAEPTLKAQPFSMSTLSSSAKTPAKNSSGRKRLLFLVLLLLAVLAGSVYWLKSNGIPIPFISSESDIQLSLKADNSETTELAPVDSTPITAPVEATGENQGAAGNAVPSTTERVSNSLSASEWKKLFDFRNLKDQKGPPFMLAGAMIGDQYPIVVGALSPLIQTDRIFLAVYPDPVRSLQTVPKIWYLQSSVIDGIFSAGPLNLNSKTLPTGRYKVLVQTSEAYLGDASFDVGVWPDPAKLGALNTAMMTEARDLAARERDALNIKLKEIKAALLQLKSKSMSATAKGAKLAKEWKEFSKSWGGAFDKALLEQRSVVQGAMFYPEMQIRILTYMEAVRVLEDSYALLARGGQKALAKSGKRKLQNQLADLSKMETDLGLELPGLDKVDVKPLQVSLENVRKGLEYFLSTGRSATK